MKKITRGSTLKRNLTAGAAILLLVAGGYLLWLSLAPMTVPLPAVNKTAEEILPSLREKPRGNRLYIPKIGVEIDLVEGDGPVALEKGAWHRWPERGNPTAGGNFIISAHRFELGFTPGETIRKSPFYHFDKLETGDSIIVDFNGQRYNYEITERFSVKPNDVHIEAPSEEAKMTLYTCTLQGEQDGREVLLAKLKAEPPENS